MVIRRLDLKQLCIPFKIAFSHASAKRSETSSLWVEAVSERGHVGHGESCPRQYVTGETLDSAKAFFTRHRTELQREINDLVALQAWMAAHEDDLDANPAAWCAIELAILDVLAQERGQSVEALLSLPPLQGRFRYSAVLGDADPAAFKTNAEQYRDHGFTDFKLKLSGNLARDRDKISVLRQWNDASIRIRVDANNLWQDVDAALTFLRALDFPFFAVEEPIQPNRYADLAQIAAALDTKIIIDESFVAIRQLESIRHAPARWLINLRVSKMGGLVPQSLVREHDAEARATKLPVSAGEALLIHNQVWHRSKRATNGRPRRALTVCYMSAETRCRRKKRAPRAFFPVFRARP